MASGTCTQPSFDVIFADDVLLQPDGGAALGRGTTRTLAVDVGDDDGISARHHPLRDSPPAP